MDPILRKCCVPGCGNIGGWPFPAEETERREWESAVTRDNNVVTKDSRICFAHFKPSDFVVTQFLRDDGSKINRKYLKTGVVPSLLLQSQEIRNTGKIPCFLRENKTTLNNQQYKQKPIKGHDTAKKMLREQQTKSIIEHTQEDNVCTKEVKHVNISNEQINLKSNAANIAKEASTQIKETDNTVEEIHLVMETEDNGPEIEFLDRDDFGVSLEVVSSDTNTQISASANSLEEQRNETKRPVVTQPIQKCIDTKRPVVTQPIQKCVDTKRPVVTQPIQKCVDTKRPVVTQTIQNTKPPQASNLKQSLPLKNEIEFLEMDNIGSSLEIVSSEAKTQISTSENSLEPVVTQNNTCTKTIQASHLIKSMPLTAKKTETDCEYEIRLEETEKQLRTELRELKKEIKQYKKNKYYKIMRIKKLKNPMTHPEFLKCIEKLPPVPRMFTKIQLRLACETPKARRFTDEEREFALNLYTTYPDAYRYMRRIGCILPSKEIMRNLERKKRSEIDREDEVVKLKEKVNNMRPSQRLCILLFEEQLLRPENRKQQIITTDTENGNEVVFDADHTLLFMVKSIMTQYKEPVSYTFSYGETSDQELATHIKNVISDLQALGLTILATVCSHTDKNRQAMDILINETRHEFLLSGIYNNGNVFTVNNQQVIAIYDPPHLLKGIRNHLMSKDLEYVDNGRKKIAKWRYLQLALKENPEINKERPIPKFTENHVYPTDDKLSETKYAAQVFSQTVASYMGYLADKGILPPESQDTADLLLFFDQLFDSLNGFQANTNRTGKPLLYSCKKDSPHHKKWIDSIQVIQSMRFKQNGIPFEVVDIECWVWTLQSIQMLMKSLLYDYNVPFVWMKSINQDILERMFLNEVNPNKKGKLNNTNQNNHNDVVEEVVTQKVIGGLARVTKSKAACETKNKNVVL